MFREFIFKAGYTVSMNAVGLITEYNPLHEGHLHHIEQTRKLLNPDVLVVIMTSWFSSRGLPSLLGRHDKTKLAMKAGADLVLELPCIYAAQSADRFALYAIESLKTAGVTAICFGSEKGDICALENLADQLENAQADPSTSMIRNTEKLLNEPLSSNDILGIQYIRYCRMFGISPYCIQRNDAFKSATATRADYFSGRKEFLSEYFQQEQSWESYYPYLRNQLVLTSAHDLNRFFLVSEGIENRLKKAAQNCRTWDEFLRSAISKTYTKARIQRTCLFILLQITKEQMNQNDSFFLCRVLGMNEKGRALLRSRPAGTPVISRFRDLPPFLQMTETKSRYLYESVMNEPLKNEDRMVISVEEEN